MRKNRERQRLAKRGRGREGRQSTESIDREKDSKSRMERYGEGDTINLGQKLQGRSESKK